MDTLIKIKGIIEFDPKNITKKHKSQSSWKRVAMIKTNCDLDKYYSWFLKKRFNLELLRSIRGSHITFISDILDNDIFDKASDIFNGKEIDFYIELEPKSDGKHWWLRTHCPLVETIRESMGLNKSPYFGLHLTLGYANEKNIEHSKYILDICNVFNIISNEPRKDLSKYKII